MPLLLAPIFDGGEAQGRRQPAVGQAAGGTRYTLALGDRGAASSDCGAARACGPTPDAFRFQIYSSPSLAALALIGLLPLAGCEIPPSGIPTAADIRGLKPVGDGDDDPGLRLRNRSRGSGTLAFRGRTYPFTLIGSLNGVGAIATTEASGEVYNLHDPSQFSGAWIQGNGNLAVSTLANGELWLQNNHGVVMRLNAQQAGITLSNGRYEIFIHMGG